MYRLLLYLVAGWSGFFVMALELLGGRLLAPYFGSSIYVWGAIITVFMLALSFGYLLGGHWSRSRPSLARLSLLLWAAAAASTPIMLAGDALLDAMSAHLNDPRAGSLCAALLLFMLPTVISGMVSPYAVRLLVADRASAGLDAGRLYFVSTFGSAAGTLLTSFYLVLYFEVNQILWAMLAMSTVIGALGIWRRPAPVAALLALLCWGAPPDAAAEGARAAGALRLVHTERSLYRQVLVYEDAGSRCLCFTRQCTIGRQSCMDLAQPDQLVFMYTRMMLGALLLNPEPREVLIIGLGGGSLPHALARLLPQAQIDLVEIDPAVVRVAGDYFSFHATERMHVYTEDGRSFVRRTARGARRYDLIMLDAYDHQYIPEHMLTEEFLREVRSLLRPGAVLAANTFSNSRLYDSESVTYARVFGGFFNLRRGNRVILARLGALPAAEVLRANATRLAPAFKPLGVAPAELLELYSQRVDWNINARVLTDQYAPANLLNAAP
ncbi:MAG: fused MFS/spermidine synthase [Steroidobacteraceae bacterium]